MSAPEFDIALNHEKVQEEVFGLLALLKPDWQEKDVKIKVKEYVCRMSYPHLRLKESVLGHRLHHGAQQHGF